MRNGYNSTWRSNGIEIWKPRKGDEQFGQPVEHRGSLEWDGVRSRRRVAYPLDEILIAGGRDVEYDKVFAATRDFDEYDELEEIEQEEMKVEEMDQAESQANDVQVDKENNSEISVFLKGEPRGDFSCSSSKCRHGRLHKHSVVGGLNLLLCLLQWSIILYSR